MKKFVYILLFIAVWFFVPVPCSVASAQPKQDAPQVTGRVVDEHGSPVVGAAVVVAGTQSGATTDTRGRFTIKGVNAGTLQVRFIGYQTAEVNIQPRKTHYDITLQEEIRLVDEVVVIGYSAVPRKDLTGSVAAMRSDELMKTGSTDFTSALQGRMAGVRVTTQSGEAGAGVDITIRGTNSLNAGTAPLYVIDGMQIDVNEGEVATSSAGGGQNTYNPLASINPNDIASIDVLKDASAAAIYGARGANGVIIITTKSGSSSLKTDINLNMYFGVQQITRQFDVLDGQGYVDYKFARGSDKEIWGKDYQDGNGVVPRNVAGDGLQTFDYQDAMTRTGFMQNYDVSLNTVANKTRISASLGYYDQQGIIESNGFQRYSGRIKVDHEINRKFSAGISATFGRVDNKGAMSSGGVSGTGGYTGIVQMMYTERPVILYTASELAGEYADYVDLTSMISNEVYKRSLFDRLLGNVYVQYKPIADLRIRVSGSLSDTNSKLSEFYSSRSRWGRGSDGRSQITNTGTLGYTLNATAEYTKRFNKVHNFGALVGVEINGYHYENSSTRVDNFEDQSTGVFDIGKGLTPQSWNSNVYQTNRASAFARLSYNFDNRYYLTVNMRVDGSSNFAKNNRVGYFPSLAAAWRIDKEGFMKEVKAINNFKIRASAGITGNDRITSYSYLSQMGSSYYASNGSLNYGMAITNSGNPGLKWETTYQYDVGLDLDLFKSRISLTADYYLKDTRDMLYNASIPSQSGYSKQWKNLGRMTNQGFEFTLTTQNVNHKKFGWTTTVNFDTNKTRLISLGGQERYFPVSQNYGSFSGQEIARVVVGEPIGVVYGYVWDGNYQLSDFDWTDPNTGTRVDPSVITSENMSRFKYTLKEGVPSFEGKTVAPGDRKYRDLTGEGVVNSNDRTAIGNTDPLFNFGINNEFRIGSLDVGVFIDGSYGGKILNAFRRQLEPSLNNNINNLSTEAWEGRWTPENGSNVYARLLNQTDQQVSTYYVEDGSYLRIKNLNVGYTFGRKYFGRSGISKLRVYLLIDNVYTFTKYSGLDPEVRSYEKFLRALDQTSYPRTRNYMAGVNITF